MVITFENISKDLVFEITQKIYFSSTNSIMFNEREEFGSVFWTIQRLAELGDEKIYYKFWQISRTNTEVLLAKIHKNF